MSLLITVLAAVAVGGPQADELLFAKIVPNPTGKNAYEDFLRAGDMVGSGLWRQYENWISYKRSSAIRDRNDDLDAAAPDLPPGVTPEMSDLAIRRAANEHLGAAIEIIRIGNEKQSYDPRPGFGLETAFPEFARFKTLAKIDMNRAHVEFADGRTTQAVDDLLEGITFARKIYGSTSISTLVSSAVQAIMLAEFQEHLGQLSFFDAQTIDKRCKKMIDTPLPVADIFNNELNMVVHDLDAILDNPNLVLSDTELKSFAPAFKGLSVTDRQQLKDMLTKSLQDGYGEAASRLDGPETGWLLRDRSNDPAPSMSDNSASNLALVLVTALQGKAMQRQYAQALAKSRVQLRLLRLHAKVIEYHWQHNQWPTKMAEFADKETAFDPFGGEQFHYELKDGGYRLYSLGIPGLGPIELKYHPISTSQSIAPVDRPA